MLPESVVYIDSFYSSSYTTVTWEVFYIQIINITEWYQYTGKNIHSLFDNRIYYLVSLSEQDFDKMITNAINIHRLSNNIQK